MTSGKSVLFAAAVKGCRAKLVVASVCAVVLAGSGAFLRGAFGAHAVSESSEVRSISTADIANAIHQLERAFPPVVVDAQIEIQSWSPVEGAWKWAGETIVTARMSGAPGGPCVALLRKQVSRWIDGPADFAEKTGAVSYDGRVGVVLDLTTGPRGSTAVINRAAVFPERPNKLNWVAVVSGWSESVFGFFEEDGLRFSEVLQQDPAAFACNEIVNQAGGLQLRTPPQPDAAGINRIWYFDRMPALALVRYEELLGDTLVRVDTISSFCELKEGIRYPVSGERVLFDSKGKRQSKWSFRCEAVRKDEHDETAQQPWIVDFPPGTFVNDTILDSTYRIGLPKSDLAHVISRQASEARSVMDPGILSGRGRVLGGATRAREGTHAVRISWLIGIASLFGGMVLIWLTFRRDRVRGVGRGLLLAVMWLVAVEGHSFAQEATIIPEVLGESRAQNCAVNTAAFVLDTLRKPVDDYDLLAADLGCGMSSWDRAVSLRDIKRVLEERGLLVTGFAGAEDLRSVLDILDEKRGICIVHLANGREEVGHYAVLVSHENEKVYIVDPGVSASWQSVSDAEARIGSLVTGFGLSVSVGASFPEGGASERGPIVWDGLEGFLEVPFGDVDPSAGLVARDVIVRNSLSDEIRLIDTKSSCSCVKALEFVGDGDSVPAGGRGVLRTTIDASRLSPGKISTTSLIRFSVGGEQRQVSATITYRVSSSASAVPHCIPTTLNLARISAGSSIVRGTIRVVLPGGERVTASRASSAEIEVMRGNRSLLESNDRLMRWHVEDLEVLMVVPLEGRTVVREKLVVETTCSRGPKMVIPIVGRFDE